MDCLEAQIHHLMISHVQRERTWKNKISGGSKLYRPILIGCMRNMTTVCGFQILCFCRLAPAILQVKPVCLFFKTCNNNISMVKTYIYMLFMIQQNTNCLWVYLVTFIGSWLNPNSCARITHKNWAFSLFAEPLSRASQGFMVHSHGLLFG